MLQIHKHLNILQNINEEYNPNFKLSKTQKCSTVNKGKGGKDCGKNALKN